MPLTRANVTAASRVMLPVYVITFCWIGGSWAFTDEGRLIKTPALEYANAVLPLPFWGVLLVWTGLLILGAILSGRRDFCRLALWVGLVVMGVFCALFTFAAAYGQASPSAPAWPFIIAAACFASDRSLLKGEVS